MNKEEQKPIKELSLDEFLNKAIDKCNKEKNEDNIDIPGWGLIPFKKPTNDQTLDYLNSQANSVKFDKEGKVLETDLRILTEAAAQFIYFSCPYLQNPDFQESIEVKDPLDTAIKVFGVENVNDIANLIHQKFSGEKIKKKIKNS